MTAWQCKECGRKLANALLPVRCLCGATDAMQRKQNIDEALARQARLLSWLHFLHLPTDRGAGDTATRLLASTKPATDARRELKRLLAKCSCSPADAVERLNREHGW